MKDLKEKVFETNSYVRDTPSLSKEDFAIMIAYDNDEISIDDLDFQKKKFNALDYVVNN
jgi:hypothetical protein